MAGIQRHVTLGAAGWIAGTYINKWIESNSAERDAVLKHYIQLHQEDFPVPGETRLVVERLMILCLASGVLK